MCVFQTGQSIICGGCGGGIFAQKFKAVGGSLEGKLWMLQSRVFLFKVHRVEVSYAIVKNFARDSNHWAQDGNRPQIH